MKAKMKLKIATDIVMTAALLLLMTYELIGQAGRYLSVQDIIWGSLYGGKNDDGQD